MFQEMGFASDIKIYFEHFSRLILDEVIGDEALAA